MSGNLAFVGVVVALDTPRVDFCFLFLCVKWCLSFRLQMEGASSGNRFSVILQCADKVLLLFDRGAERRTGKEWSEEQSKSNMVACPGVLFSFFLSSLAGIAM